jgi:hypothetical protein
MPSRRGVAFEKYGILVIKLWQPVISINLRQTQLDCLKEAQSCIERQRLRFL